MIPFWRFSFFFFQFVNFCLIYFQRFFSMLWHLASITFIYWLLLILLFRLINLLDYLLPIFIFNWIFKIILLKVCESTSNITILPLLIDIFFLFIFYKFIDLRSIDIWFRFLWYALYCTLIWYFSAIFKIEN